MTAVLATLRSSSARIEELSQDRPDGPIDLDVQALCKAFDPNHPILHYVNFTVHRREAVALMARAVVVASTV